METRPLGDGSLLAMPHHPTAAVLVLSGASGLLATERVRLLAAHGVAALAFRWFGGPGQPPGICEVALESFAPAMDLLHAMELPLVVVGLSKGAEAALLLATDDPRISLCVALSPSSVVWANVGPGADGLDRPCRSSFTRGGSPLPFIPYDDSWRPPSGVPAFRGVYEQSLITYASRVPAAEIPVERIHADLVVTAGGDDQVWPSEVFARQIEARRHHHGLATTVLLHPAAGHRLQLPGEPTPPADLTVVRGGTTDADQELGSALWAELTRRLDLRPARAPEGLAP